MIRLKDAPIQGRNVLIIADFNITIAEGAPLCTFKIDQALPTIEHVLASGCRSLTIASHLGRPQDRHEFSTKPVYGYLATRISGIKYKEIVDYLINGTCLNAANTVQLTDNLRYYSDGDLRRFYDLFDVVVNDAFGSAHRPVHGSAYAGLLMAKEIENLSRARHADLVIMGGAKIKDKLRIMEHFSGIVYLGGCLAISVLRALGHEVGKYSRVEEHGCAGLGQRVISGAEAVGIVRGDTQADSAAAGRCAQPRHAAREDVHEEYTPAGGEIQAGNCIAPISPTNRQPVLLHSEHAEASVNIGGGKAVRSDSHSIRSGGDPELKIVLPVDFFVIEHAGEARNCKIKRYNEMAASDECVDIGPESIGQLRALVEASASIFWNGPLGKMEMPEASSTGILAAILEGCAAETFLGGGETLTAVMKYSDAGRFTHVSTGGGAMLQYLSGGDMPGISALL